MSSVPPASKGMMWSASVAGALLQMTQVIGPLVNSSLRALRNSGVARRVMLVSFLCYRPCPSDCGWFHVTGWGWCGDSPPHFELLTQAAGCVTPVDGHH